MPKRSKIVSLARLKKKLDEVFKAYIRKRDLRHDGTFVCVSCYQTKTKDQMHAGHFWAAGKYTAVRWDEMNVWGQCAHCNTFLHGNLYNYSKSLKLKLGQGFDLLEERAHQPMKLDRQWLEEKIKHYQNLIK